MSIKETPRSDKLEQLLSTARELFFKHGIRRVAVQEICTVANVSKVTFYRYFPNKMALAETVIRDLAEHAIADFQRLCESSLPAEEIIHKTIRAKKEWARRIGPELLKELYDPAFGLQPLLAEITQKGMAAFNTFVTQRQATHEIRRDLKPEFLLAVIERMQQWVNDESFTALFNNPSDMAMELNNFFFYGIMNGPPKTDRPGCTR